MTQDTRKDPRAKIVSLNVRYKSATVDEFIDNHSHDVSKGGIFIKTPSPFPPGTLLKFEIRIAGDKAVIAGVGRVVWKREAAQSNSEQPAGMGVKFIKIDDPSRAVIDRLVDSKGGAGSAYEEGGGDLSAGLPPAPEAATPAPAVVAKDTRKIAPKPASISAPPPPAAHTKPQPAASRAPSMGPTSSGKATMMGLGGVSGVAAGRAAGAPTPAAGRPAGEDARRHTPYGGMGAPRPVPSGATAPPVAAPASSDAPAMFPKTNSLGEMPPTGDQTVMKQAAELLEEALRGAGGSMDEIGQNPLFDQVSSKTKDAESAATLAKLKEPAAGNPHEIVQSPGPVDVDELMRPIPELERNVAAERARRSSFPPAATPRGTPLAQAESETTSRKPKDGGAARPASAVAAVGDRPPRSKWLVSILLLGAAGGLGFFAYTQMHSSETDDAIPPISVPSVSASAQPIPPPASASAPVASASVQPTGDVMLEGGTGDAALATADASIVDSGRPLATATPVAAPAAPSRPSPRKPAAAPTAAPASPDESAPAPAATAAGTSSASPTPAATAPPADTPNTPPTATPKPTGKPATKPKSDDDNPY